MDWQRGHFQQQQLPFIWETREISVWSTNATNTNTNTDTDTNVDKDTSDRRSPEYPSKALKKSSPQNLVLCGDTDMLFF